MSTENKETKKPFVKFSLDDDLMNLIDANKDTINKTTINSGKSENAVDPSSYYEIKPNDSLFTEIVKERINAKKVNLKSLAFDDPRELNNYKRSLKIHETMSINKFERWMQLLGIEWLIIYGDTLAKFRTYLDIEKVNGLVDMIKELIELEKTTGNTMARFKKFLQMERQRSEK